MAESARRIRARTRASVCLWSRPDYGDRRRQHALAAGAPHRPPDPAASAGLFGPRASQPQRCATLSLSVRYFALIWNAVVHWRVVLTGFSSMALSSIFTAMAAASDRTRHFPLAAQGTRNRSPAAYLFRRPGRRPPHTNFRFGRDTGDRRSFPGRFSVISGLATASRLLAVPSTFQRGRYHSDCSVCIGEVGQSCPQRRCPRGGTVSPKSCRVLAGERPTPENFRLLRLGRLCDLETLSRISRVRGRPRGPLRRQPPAAV